MKVKWIPDRLANTSSSGTLLTRETPRPSSKFTKIYWQHRQKTRTWRQIQVSGGELRLVALCHAQCHALSFNEEPVVPQYLQLLLRFSLLLVIVAPMLLCAGEILDRAAVVEVSDLQGKP